MCYIYMRRKVLACAESLCGRSAGNLPLSFTSRKFWFTLPLENVYQIRYIIRDYEFVMKGMILIGILGWWVMIVL